LWYIYHNLLNILIYKNVGAASSIIAVSLIM